MKLKLKFTLEFSKKSNTKYKLLKNIFDTYKIKNVYAKLLYTTNFKLRNEKMFKYNKPACSMYAWASCCSKYNY